MRLTRFCLAIATAAVVATPLLAAPTASAAGAPARGVEGQYPTALSLGVEPIGTPVYGSTLELSGQLLYAPEEGVNEGVAGATVELERKLRGSDTWQSVGTTVTAEPAASGYDGPTYTFVVKAKSSAAYRVSYDGNTPPEDEKTYQPSEVKRSIGVTRDLNDKWKRDGRKYFIVGNVNPGWERKIVTLYRKTCATCNWREYGRDRTSRTGAFALQVAFPPKPGTWSFRAKVPGDDAFNTSYSTEHQTITK